ncbi:MAG: acyl-CoA dehydrogenase family protein [Myxococcota bacterium]
MNFEFDETQKMIQDLARRFADEQLRPKAAARDASHAFPVEELKALADLGLMGVNVPAELGGAEAGVLSYSLAVAEIARGDASVAVTMSVNNMVAEVLTEFGTEEHKATYVPKLTSGASLAGSFCLSEAGAGSDPQGMLTRAERTDTGWVLRGSKAWITSGSHAGVFIVWAKTEVDGKDRLSAFVVDPTTPGISVGKAEEKMGQRASNTVSLTFEDVELPEGAVLGELGRGMRIAMTALDGGRIGIASLALGLATEALEVSRQYVTERTQFGSRLADFQNTQFKLADMATELEAARLLTHQAAWLKEHGTRRFTREASMAKLFASELASRAADQAIQFFGGYGYTAEYPAERLWRDARVTRIYEGTSEIQRIVIAREVLAGL